MSPSPSTTTAAADADAAAPPGGMQGGGRLPTVLRFIHINDCYELENLPRFATAIREARAEAAAAVARGEAAAVRVVAAIVGDFLAPSLLSCLDQGRGMIDVLNACGVDIAIFGNHETDIPHKALLQRIHESRFVWVNSNMPALPLLEADVAVAGAEGGGLPLDLSRSLSTSASTGNGTGHGGGGNGAAGGRFFTLDRAAKLPESLVLEVGMGRRVGLLGLLTEDPSLYRPDAFMLTPILPVRETAARLQRALMARGDLDCVVALTHQSMPLDRELAAAGLFPLILGGHDHDAHLEAIPHQPQHEPHAQKSYGNASSTSPSAAGQGPPATRVSSRDVSGGKATVVVKVGVDCKAVGITDVVVDAGDAGDGDGVVVESEMREIGAFAPDAAVERRVHVHLRVLEELERASLCPCPSNLPLSSRGIRKMQTTVGTMLVTACRKALQVDVCMINAGNIRNNTAYPFDKTTFTYKDLKAEVPFPCEMVVVRAPGTVLSDLLAFSRRFALQDPPVEKGGYLQVDDGVRVDPRTNRITHVGGEPFDPERLYSLATTYGVVSGIDDLRPILDYRAAHPDGFPAAAEAGRPLKEVLVAHFSRLIWWDLAKNLGFQAMDSNGNGVLSPREVEEAAMAHYGEALSQLVLANIMATADFDGDGHVSPEEFVRICLQNEALFEDGDADKDQLLSLADLWAILKQHFAGKAETGTRSPIPRHAHSHHHDDDKSCTRPVSPKAGKLSEEDVARLFAEIDVEGTGAVTWAQFRYHLARQPLPTRLII